MLPGSTLNRMIFWELVRVFGLALCGLTGLFLLAGLIQQANQMGLSPAQVVAVIPLFVPSTLPYTVPATVLFASCVVYGRLAHDNEVVAVRAAGVHLFVILRPALLLGVLTAGATAALCHTVIPVTQRRLTEEVLSDPEEVLYNALRREKCIRHPTFPYVLYVKDVQGRRLVDVVIKKRRAVKDGAGNEVPGKFVPGYELVVRAREARLRVDADEGKLYVDADRLVLWNPDSRGWTASNQPFPMELPANLTAADARGRTNHLTWDDLGPRAEQLGKEREGIERRRADEAAKADREADPAARARYAVQDAGFGVLVGEKARQVRNVEAEFHLRPALAAGCLVFALLGCPVGIWANRADYLSTFVICFLPAVFVYYPLLLAGSNMGKDGKVPLGLGCWLANIVVGAAGLGLVWRLLRR
ncbi:MAG: LptF/LptG family permease [Gemmataceae bacterium]|nr:LptF/LptG family permease [Gemmataceae bacterium]